MPTGTFCSCAQLEVEIVSIKGLSLYRRLQMLDARGVCALESWLEALLLGSKTVRHCSVSLYVIRKSQGSVEPSLCSGFYIEYKLTIRGFVGFRVHGIISSVKPKISNSMFGTRSEP